MSLGGPITFAPSACSGDMYSGVPTKAPAIVSPEATFTSRARPKSIK